MADRESHAHRGGSAENDPSGAHLRQIIHDFRHCLFTIRTGIQLLRKSSHDPHHIEEILSSMDHDEQRATQLLEEFVAIARKASAD